MLASLIQHSSSIDKSTKATHILAILPRLERLPRKYEIPGEENLKNLLNRRHSKLSQISESPVTADLDNGAICTWVMVDTDRSIFEQQTIIRKAAQTLLAENPIEIHVAVFGSTSQKKLFAKLAVYIAWINGAVLPVRKKSPKRTALSTITLHGHKDPDNFSLLHAQAEGNLLARGLTVLPPNELTPATYREQIKKLSVNEGWEYQEYDLNALRKMGAGAFIAVAQGSPTEDAAIVHLQRHVNSSEDAKTIALVGKGICYDTGGHNLKPARHMHGMHEDMNGSAVALGILLAATHANLPINIDCWLAIAQNHISPNAYQQNDVITAYNGLTIEVMHTDAEGRMVLADTLTLAEKHQPDLIINFATLTGSMHTALGSRYSGIFSNKNNLIQKALAAGTSSGERVCAFPMDSDYDEALESQIADTKQCTIGGDFDHILAARFLDQFLNDTPWVHMDLSACHHKDGLGAVGSNVTGFGVAWAIELLQDTATL